MMKKHYKNSAPLSFQNGATLIVALVILAVITLLGVASMRSSNLELKMAASARDRAVAFQAAESALQSIERDLGTLNENEWFSINSFTPACSEGNRCFNSSCRFGLCFSGDLENIVNRDECSLAKAAAGGGVRVVKQHWRDEELWDMDNAIADVPASLNVLINNDGDELTSVPVRYLIEFLCFVPKSEDATPDPEEDRNTGVPLFQVTARAEGEMGRSTVMLQSVFRAAGVR